MGKTAERFAETGNAAILAIIHTAYGAFISYVLYYLFDEFDDSWKARSSLYQITDVSVEIMLIAIFGYWASEITQLIPPIFPTSKAKELAVDSWVSGIFFVIALFLFLDELTEKLKYIQNKFFEDLFSWIFPKYGSIVDMNLSYTPTTEEELKAHNDENNISKKVTTGSAHATDHAHAGHGK
uniref:Uncharacterized protein n=1 Tax=viral metagenome TaxID=1070528 RepID=A0A6C0B235_9ZZZZ